MSPQSPPATDQRSDPGPYVVCTAELAECTCPDACDRDHDNE